MKPTTYFEFVDSKKNYWRFVTKDVIVPITIGTFIRLVDRHCSICINRIEFDPNTNTMIYADTNIFDKIAEENDGFFHPGHVTAQRLCQNGWKIINNFPT